MAKRRFIEIKHVKEPMPKCFGKRCDYTGGYCSGCTVYVGCTYVQKDHDFCVEHKLIPEEDY